MEGIEFRNGVSGQAIYTGLCECGAPVSFTPGGKTVTCGVCQRKWQAEPVKVKLVRRPKGRAKGGPKETK